MNDDDAIKALGDHLGTITGALGSMLKAPTTRNTPGLPHEAICFFKLAEHGIVRRCGRGAYDLGTPEHKRRAEAFVDALKRAQRAAGRLPPAGRLPSARAAFEVSRDLVVGVASSPCR